MHDARRDACAGELSRRDAMRARERRWFCACDSERRTLTSLRTSHADADAMFARAAPAIDAPHVARAFGASARRARRHGRRATRITTPRAVSDGEAPNDVEASTSAPAKVGRFVKRDASDTREVQAPLGAGPGDVGARGSAPPAMNIKVIPLGETKRNRISSRAARGW
jgi:hypothetical protein